RFDALHVARIQTVRLDQLARHHPLATLFRQHRIWCDEELDAARAEVFVALHALHADVAEQPAQQSFVDLFICRGLRRTLSPTLPLRGRGRLSPILIGEG